MTPPITTEHVYPPIPDRRWDWMAHYADDDEDPEHPMPKGWGRTEDEARADLVENFPR